MIVHVIGTSHVLALMRSMQKIEKEGPDDQYRFYYSNNSSYGLGEFSFKNGRIIHSAKEVSDSWATTSGSGAIDIDCDDIIVAFGFDEFYDKYAFLTQPEPLLSKACRSDLLDDISINRNLRSLLTMAKRSNGKIVVVDPPLFGKELQQKKSGEQLIHLSKFSEISERLTDYLASIDAHHLRQPKSTIAEDGNYVFSKPEHILTDGFHWSELGISFVLSDLRNLVGKILRSDPGGATKS